MSLSHCDLTPVVIVFLIWISMKWLSCDQDFFHSWPTWKSRVLVLKLLHSKSSILQPVMHKQRDVTVDDSTTISNITFV